MYYNGKLIKLRGIKLEDYTECLHRWADDSEFNRYLSTGLKPSTIPMMEKLFEGTVKGNNVVFAIVVKEVGTVGLIGIYNINNQTRQGEYRIHIGKKEFWGTGVSKEATEFIIRYAFETLNLNKVYLGVNAEHERAYKFYKKMRFIEEGRLRQELYRNGKYYDAARMSILREEWQNTRQQ